MVRVRDCARVGLADGFDEHVLLADRSQCGVLKEAHQYISWQLHGSRV